MPARLRRHGQGRRKGRGNQRTTNETTQAWPRRQLSSPSSRASTWSTTMHWRRCFRASVVQSTVFSSLPLILPPNNNPAIYSGVPSAEQACGSRSNCINRACNLECSKDECPCRQKCQNQMFQRRQYASVEIFETPGKGFGLRTAGDLSRYSTAASIGCVCTQRSVCNRVCRRGCRSGAVCRANRRVCRRRHRALLLYDSQRRAGTANAAIH